MEKYSMMKMPCIEIGRALACSSDEEQAAVINSLALELKIVCKDQSLSGLQVCYFASKLNEHGKLLVKALVEFVELREKENK